MIDKNISPETRKAYIETCEVILSSKPFSCSGIKCRNCTASSSKNNGIDCWNVKGGRFDNAADHPAIRAYFERTLKELKAMETKMTKEEALRQQSLLEITILDNELRGNKYKKELADLQAIIDAPEVDPRVGKLFWFWDYEETEKCATIFYDQDGKVFKHCRPVTREEALAMVYEPEMVNSCGNCGNLTGYCIKRLPKVCDNWTPK